MLYFVEIRQKSSVIFGGSDFGILGKFGKEGKEGFGEKRYGKEKGDEMLRRVSILRFETLRYLSKESVFFEEKRNFCGVVFLKWV